ncbi:polymorphic toxin-type HINT domain-containing protein [Kitasatospora sp. NPDC053057]|uniref:polymorphic toxin-type HINT domain-containing protein n=1 Tax=Kitasatospora sp. NPDC053057 TaxID=3364062 RepID=UPI0037C5A21D
MTLSLLTPMAVAESVVGGYHYTDKEWAADPLPQPAKVPGHPVGGTGAKPVPVLTAGARELTAHKPVAPVWPTASTVTVDLGAAAGGAERTSAAPAAVRASDVRTDAGAGSSPVSMAAAEPSAVGTRARALVSPLAPLAPVSSVQVRTADHEQTRGAGVDGLLVGLERADKGAGVGGVSVSLDYGAVEQAYGGGWASRLHLVALPGCALTSPQLPSCRVQKPIESVNDPAAKKLTATVALPPAAPAAKSASPFASRSALAAQAAPGMAVAAVAGSGGSQGDYGATSLSASGAWSTSSSGAFTYRYPITLPPALGGVSPLVALSYDSQSVDGETSARNSQSSWIGDGWAYSPGFIERSYKPCRNDGIDDSGDECWAGWNATISLGSHNGKLIRDSDGVYRLPNDDGTRIERLTGASNGLWDGEYFKVTTTDGTSYYLGLDHAPGTTTDAATNSAWGVPVYHPKSDDPCHDSGKGNDSRCDKPVGYRFNLDFVVDAHGNTQRYDWATESNYYNMGYGQVAKNGDGGTMTQYTRGGHLTQVSYGYQLADAQAGHEPSAKVVFNAAQRCTTSDSVCQASNLSKDTAANWPDTPYDLTCKADDKTKADGDNTDGVCLMGGPSFWSTYRLKSIDTKVKVGNAWQDVDTYDLNQVFSDAGGTMDPVTGKTQDPKTTGALQSVMWLSQIVHTGKDTSAGGTGSLALDPVSFVGVELDNRVDGLSPAAPPLYHPRVSSIQTETGESIAVSYRAPECSRDNNHMPSSADSNTMGCYPVFWNTPGGKDPIADWFNKTMVAQVAESDRTKAGSPAKVTNYAYGGGAAWHRDDSELTDDKHRTWNEFRGYRTVTTTTGAAPDPITQTTVSYLQGMDGDYKADGTQRSVKLANSLGEQTTDSPWLAGTAQETDSYTQAGGSINRKVLTDAPGTTVTATAARTAWTSEDPAPAKLSTLPDQTARRVQSTGTRSMGLLSDGTWRTTQTKQVNDALGRLSQVDDKGDLADPSQESCTTTKYADAPAASPLLLTVPDETITVSGPCGTPESAATTLSHKRMFYDGDGSVTNPGTLGTLGQNGSTLGLVTATQAVTSYDAQGRPVFQTIGALSYDKYGRVIRSRDGAGAATTTSYSPDSGTLPTSISTTNPLGWTSSSTVAPTRAAVTHAVDSNGRVTDVLFDALGRRTRVWFPGRNKATQSPDKIYSYAVHGAGDNPDPNSVTTQSLREDGSYGFSASIYDGLLQLRQEQATTADNSAGRLVKSTFYDSHGWTVGAIAPYSDPANAPGTAMWAETNNTGPSVTRTRYDGQGRAVSSELDSFATTVWRSSTAYRGVDRVDTTPPGGGKATTTYTDAQGRTTATVSRDTTGDKTLAANSAIQSGSSEVSGSVRLAAQADGNLVLTALTDGRTLWSAGTSGHPGAYATVQADGNFVVKDPKGVQLWSSNTAGHPGAVVKVQGDGNLGVYDAVSTLLWSSGTANSAATADITTHYTYTAAGKPATIKDTVGNTWSYTYDLQGRKLTQTDPDSGTSSTSYDAMGRVTSTTDARGQTLSYTYDPLGRKTGEYMGSDTSDPAKLLADWTYDSLSKGSPTASTRYVGGKNGSAYVSRIDGYTTVGQPTGATFVIPAAEGKLAGTYSIGAAYTANVNLLASTTFGSEGGLPSETVGFGYNLQGLLSSMGSPSTPYVATTNYSPTGQVWQTTIGSPTKQLRTAQTYDQATGRLATNRVTLQNNTANPISNLTLGYDESGNLTTASDVQSGGGTDRTTDTQCFTYDAQDRLVTAWTDTKGITGATAGQLARCNTAKPSPATIGGPNPYWQDWQFNQLGDRTQQVSHDVTGNAAKDTTQTITYPGAGTATAYQPNAAATVTISNPTTGTTTLKPAYDKAGNTLGRVTTGAKASNQSFAYDAEGRTQTATTDGKQSGYLYDADGNLLLQRGPGNTTLYLFGGVEQLSLDAVGKTVTGLRYYNAPDGTTIVRSSKGGVCYQPAGRQGTAQLQVDGTSLGITRRALDPYGNLRGANPANWADNHGFLGQPVDATTGLSLLGARHYDPVTGRFLSVDPVLETGDANQMGGYAYAADNPTTGSDPKGLWWGEDWFDEAVDDTGDFLAGAADSIVGDPYEWVVDGTADVWNSCADLYNDYIYEENAWYMPEAGHMDYVDDTPVADLFGIDTDSDAYIAGQVTGTVASIAIDGYGLVKAVEEGVKAYKAADEIEEGASALKQLLSDDESVPSDPDPAPTTPKSDEPSSPKSGSSKEPNSEPGGAGKAGDDTTTSGNAPSGEDSPGGGSDSSPGTYCSFTPDTRVLMADGATKAIGDVTVGDRVQSADQDTAVDQGARTVTATWVHGDEDLLDVTVVGDDGQGTDLHTTANHPFWDDTTRTWTPAAELRPGDTLVSADGHLVRIVGTRAVAGARAMHNLTVDQLHTYYVLAGTTPVLVHNTCGEGVATLHYHGDGNHFSIEVTDGETVTHTHLMPHDGEAVVSPYSGPPSIMSRDIDLPNAKAALQFQGETQGSWGAYHPLGNSCLTYCANVLRAGGADVPEGKAAIPWARKFMAGT